MPLNSGVRADMDTSIHSAMKLIFFIAIFLTFPLLCSANSEYYLEKFTADAEKYIAASSLQNFMKLEIRGDYLDCENQLKENIGKLDNYFSSIPIKISSHSKTYLVFPSKRCFAFFGAHSIQFWIVEKSKSNSFKILLSARQDGFRILTSQTNNYYDLILLYNNDMLSCKFNGKEYIIQNK